MAPGEAVAAGGAASGGDDGSAADGDDKENASGGKGGKDAEGDNRNSNGCGDGSHGSGPCHQHPSGAGTVTAGDPVNVITGHVFTLPHDDLSLPGPVPIELTRTYDSGKAGREDASAGLGYGWFHSLA
jgi:hypothetical protein